MLGYEYFYLTKNQSLQTFKNNKILYYWAQKLSKYLVSYKGRNQFIISSFIIYLEYSKNMEIQLTEDF